jgi:hypothetical protein
MEEEAEEERRRKRLEEMRRRLDNDDIIEDGGGGAGLGDETSPSDSQTSSVEGLYGAISSGKTSHPFKVVDHDSVSMQSGISSGRVGRISGHPHLFPAASISGSSSPSHHNYNQMNISSSSSDRDYHYVPSPSDTYVIAQALGNGNLTRSGNSNPQKNFISSSVVTSAPEPDLVVSCLSKEKPTESGDLVVKLPQQPPLKMPAPIAPPRRKRKTVLLGRAQSEDGSESTTSSRDVTPQRENPSFPFPVSDQRPTSSTSSRYSSSYSTTSSSVSTVASPSNHPPSPTVSIRSVCRELDKTLDHSAGGLQRIFVVKAQDEEKTRAKNSGPKALKRTESLPKDVISAFDSGSGGFREASSNSSKNSSSTNLNPNPTSSPSEPSSQDCSSIKRGSLTSSEKSLKTISINNVRSNSAPKGSIQLSSIVSAIAALEEGKDIDPLSPFNMIRTRTDSGQLLSDLEILEQVEVSISKK